MARWLTHRKRGDVRPEAIVSSANNSQFRQAQGPARFLASRPRCVRLVPFSLSNPNTEKPMKAVTLKAFGGPEVLQVGEVPTPKPGPEQVLVRVRVTALNRADTLQRKGAYPPPPGESEIIGLELAGEVDSWGSAVTGFKKGDRVMALVGGGGYAEYCLVDKDMAMRIPDGWSFAQA